MATTHHHYILFLFLTHTLSTLCFHEAHKKGGFSVKLIHRDSPMSPFHNPTETHFNQLSNAIHRSFNRVNHFYPKTKSSRQKTPQSVITSSQGEYLVKYSIGTPPFDAMGIADTGSDLIWSQCMPCQQCYNQTTPLFDPSKSATYEPVSCYSSMCNSLGQSYCYSDTEPNCEYTVSYGDGSHSQGNLALDTITLGSTTGLEMRMDLFRSFACFVFISFRLMPMNIKGLVKSIFTNKNIFLLKYKLLLRIMIGYIKNILC